MLFFPNTRKESNQHCFPYREYLATFKKTVAMHEVFLCRLANHPIFRSDHNFRVFLEYEQDVGSSIQKADINQKVINSFILFDFFLSSCRSEAKTRRKSWKQYCVFSPKPLMKFCSAPHRRTLMNFLTKKKSSSSNTILF